MLFVQGNRELACADLLRGCWLLAEVIERFCGGRVELVAFFAAAGAGARGGSAQGGRPAEPAAGGRNLLPEVDLATFQGLQLRKGTLLQAEAVAGLPSLVTVTVRCAGEVRALAVSSILTAPAAGGAEQAGASARTGVPSATAAGQSVVLVGPLHPLQLGGTSYDHLLLTLGEGSASRLARLAAPLPDGARLY
ncbi:MAG: hypothetical protein FJ125_11855 [Deltaproteobacteria bacterium]|nr:hypothetical protein [Deltaproteobacteria bacterium]